MTDIINWIRIIILSPSDAESRSDSVQDSPDSTTAKDL